MVKIQNYYTDYNEQEQPVQFFTKDDYKDYGWIAPDGQYYKCDDFCHAKYARDVLKKDDRDLEIEGWIKITNCFGGRCVESDHYLITQAQYDTLLTHGFTEQELENECIFAIE